MTTTTKRNLQSLVLSGLVLSGIVAWYIMIGPPPPRKAGATTAQTQTAAAQGTATQNVIGTNTALAALFTATPLNTLTPLATSTATNTPTAWPTPNLTATPLKEIGTHFTNIDLDQHKDLIQAASTAPKPGTCKIFVSANKLYIACQDGTIQKVTSTSVYP